MDCLVLGCFGLFRTVSVRFRAIFGLLRPV
jgi:hypothetical protein